MFFPILPGTYARGKCAPHHLPTKSSAGEISRTALTPSVICSANETGVVEVV